MSSKAERKALQKALQSEAAAALERWGSEIKVGKAKKGAEGYPFPIYVRRVVPQPESASEFDVGELTIKFIVNGLDVGETPPEVKVADKLPKVMVKAMQKRILGEWLAAIHSEPGVWHIEAMCFWVEENFRLLCGVVDECLDPYMGVSADGATQRRFAVIEPRQEERKLTPEEEAAKAAAEEAEAEAAREYWAKKRAERAEREYQRALEEGERKRQLAEAGLLEEGPQKNI